MPVQGHRRRGARPAPVPASRVVCRSPVLGALAGDGAATPFNETILREIVQFNGLQQLELVTFLIKNAPKATEEYRKQAQRDRARNALLEEVRRRDDASRAGPTSVAGWFCVRLPAWTWVCTVRPVGRLAPAQRRVVV